MFVSTRLKRKVSRSIDSKFCRTEAHLRRNLGHSLSIEMHRQELARATGIRDLVLLDQLMDAGFCPDSVIALQLAPIAFVAWGSGSVTNREFQRAVDAIFDSALPGKSVAIKRFRSWLKKKPGDQLYQLWKDFSSAQLNAAPPRQTKQDGQRIFDQAKTVALASGGLLGVGQICGGEATVLDDIRRLYQLD